MKLPSHWHHKNSIQANWSKSQVKAHTYTYTHTQLQKRGMYALCLYVYMCAYVLCVLVTEKICQYVLNFTYTVINAAIYTKTNVILRETYFCSLQH